MIKSNSVKKDATVQYAKVVNLNANQQVLKWLREQI